MFVRVQSCGYVRCGAVSRGELVSGAVCSCEVWLCHVNSGGAWSVDVRRCMVTKHSEFYRLLCFKLRLGIFRLAGVWLVEQLVLLGKVMRG